MGRDSGKKHRQLSVQTRLMLTVAALIVMILANVAGCVRMFSHNFHS